MSWSRKVKHPSKILNVGDVIETVVLDVDLKTRRISLGVKQLAENPWQAVSARFPVGSRIHGPVRNVAEFGLFVGLSDDVDGLVHVSDICWVRPARPLGLAFPKKTEVDAVVLNIDLENERISLGMKQINDDPWGRIRKEYAIGSRHKGKVTWSGEKGVAVELEPQASPTAFFEGFIGRSELPDSEEENLAKAYPVEKEIEVVVHSLDEKEHRVSLGLVLGEGELQKQEVEGEKK